MYNILIIGLIISLILCYPTILDIQNESKKRDINIYNKLLAFIIDTLHNIICITAVLLLIISTYEVAFTTRHFYLTALVILDLIIVLLYIYNNKCILTIYYNKVLGKEYDNTYFEILNRIKCMYHNTCLSDLNKILDNTFYQTYFSTTIYILFLCIIRLFT